MNAAITFLSRLLSAAPRAELSVKLAPQSVAAWDALRAETFAGEASLHTGNSVYRFRDGVFVSRSAKGSSAPSSPDSMSGLRLIGFLVHEDGLWSLSSRYVPGAHAVLVRPEARPEAIDEGSYMVTSAVQDFQHDERDERDEAVPELDDSGIRRTDVPLRVRRPAPESVTRLHARDERTAKAG